MPNSFAGRQGGLTAPAAKIVPMTANDSTDLPEGTCRALLVGTAGAADIIDASGTARSAVPLQQGFNPIGIQRIKSTNLTAANIWARSARCSAPSSSPRIGPASRSSRPSDRRKGVRTVKERRVSSGMVGSLGRWLLALRYGLC